MPAQQRNEKAYIYALYSSEKPSWIADALKLMPQIVYPVCVGKTYKDVA